jgi:hypothetical protein
MLDFVFLFLSFLAGSTFDYQKPFPKPLPPPDPPPPTKP